jgi:hypothetical protein
LLRRLWSQSFCRQMERMVRHLVPSAPGHELAGPPFPKASLGETRVAQCKDATLRGRLPSVVILTIEIAETRRKRRWLSREITGFHLENTRKPAIPASGMDCAFTQRGDRSEGRQREVTLCWRCFRTGLSAFAVSLFQGPFCTLAKCSSSGGFQNLTAPSSARCQKVMSETSVGTLKVLDRTAVLL